MSCRRFAWVLTVAMALITSIPYFAGLAHADPDTRFDGTLIFEDDVNAYLALARQAMDGHLLFINCFTPEPHAGALFNPEWLAMGAVAAIPGSTLELGFHAVRLLGIALLVFGLLRLCDSLFASVFLRRLVALAVLLGGGFGWLLRDGLDTYAGLQPFFCMLLQPHFLLAQALSVWTLVLLLRERHLQAGLLAALTGMVRPFDALVLLGTCVLFAIFTRRARLLAVLPVVPVLGYQAWLFRSHPVFRWWGLQNIGLPPLPWDLLSGLGLVSLLLLLALATRRWRGARPGPAELLVAANLASVLVLLYAHPPFNFNMQFLPAVAIPATLLAAVAWKREAPRTILVGFLVLHSATSAVLLHAKVRAVQQGRYRTERSELTIYAWLDQHAAGEVVLAPLDESNRMTRYASVRSLCGYRYATVDFEGKSALTDEYYEPATSPTRRAQILRDWDVGFVLGGPKVGREVYRLPGPKTGREIFRSIYDVRED